MRRALTFVALAASALLSMPAGIAVAAGPGDPTTIQQQVEADRPIPVPATASCTETLMTHDFANSYGAPYRGNYSSAACPGPWSKVVLTLTSTVQGVQFDRDVYVAIGHAVVLDGSTSEPCCALASGSTWTVQRDVTDISPLLTSDQPTVVELDNVNDSTYTGVYHTVVSLTFYATGARAPEGAHPDVVIPVSSNGSGGPMLTIGADGQRVGTQVSFPANLERLTAEVFADAHGGCEEFWWGDPGNCAGTPYREVAVYVDGRLAGAAPAYPVLYTGAGGPGLWEPIPSVRAWNLRPYDLDLTPFVGQLTDGAPHSIQLGVLDTTLGSGDFWQTAANLLGWTDSGATQVTGSLLSAAAPAAPTDKVTDPTGQGVPYRDVATHALRFAGVVSTSHGQVATTVVESMGETDTQGAVPDDGKWTWDATTTTDGDGHETVADATATYSLISTELTNYVMTDDGTTTTSVDGVVTGSTAYKESMSTADTTSLVENGVEHEHYGYSDSTGVCYGHALGSQAGEVTVDQLDGVCPSLPATIGQLLAGSPGANLPEASSPALLAVIGLVIVGVVAFVRRRRRG